MRSAVLPRFVFFSLLVALPVIAGPNRERCFDATGKVAEDAQTIRLEALEMDWQVGKEASLAAARVAKAKVELFPKHDVEICLRERAGELEVRVEALSEDADRAEWKRLPGRKRSLAGSCLPVREGSC